MDHNLFRNVDFCYWLQGYFEIGNALVLDERQLDLIRQQLMKITEPWGEFTRWVNQTIHLVTAAGCRQESLVQFAEHLRLELNDLFEHVIDNSYETLHSKSFLKSVHEGII